MDLNKTEEILNEILNKNWDLGATFKTEADLLTATANVKTKAIDDGIFLTIGVFRSSTFFINFVLDKIEYSNYVSKLIYDFNANSKWLNAFIREDGYLVLEYCIRYLNEEMLESNLNFLLNEFLSDECMKFLQPLAAETKAE